MRKTDPAEPFWEWAKHVEIGRSSLPFVSLRELASAERVTVNEVHAHRILDWLRREMGEDEIPVEVIDGDGQPVAV